MLTSKEFVAKLEAENEALFRASELQIKHYYENVTDKDASLKLLRAVEYLAFQL